jgi:meso-butanediol dehydrogenase / (S,S)-butanediol dehydrogenase / diacetyl reductase
MMSNEEAAGRVAIVTGAGQGTGRVLAQRLFADGYAVALGDVKVGQVEETARDLGDADRAIALPLDVSDRNSVEAFVAATVEHFGRLDVLVNNAGVISFFPFDQISDAEWDRTIAINLKGVFLCTQVALPHLRERGWGRIVNIASDLGKRGQDLLAHYVASKFGVVGITQTLALELARGRTGITVNAICPTAVRTPMGEQIVQEMAADAGIELSEARELIAQHVPMGRPAEPTDIAHTVAWLVSDGAEFITGQSINVTGGSWMQ